MGTPSTTIAAFLAAVSPALHAAAPTGHAAAVSPVELDVIEVTANHLGDPSDALVAVHTVVHRPAAGTAQTALEALRGRPGSFYQQTTPGQGNIVLRGLKGSEVLHLVDGFRLNAAFFRNAPNQYLSLVDPLNIERIEVIRGPMSTVHGSDAVGGVIHFVTPVPEFGPEGTATDWLASGHYGSADDGLHLRAAVAIGGADWALRAGTSRQDVGRRRPGGAGRLPDTGFTSHAKDLRLAWRVLDAGTLEFTWQHLVQPSTPRYDALNPGFGQAAPESAEFAFEPQSRQLLLLKYRGPAPRWLGDDLVVQVGRQALVDGQRSRGLRSVTREWRRVTSDLDGLLFEARRWVGSDLELRFGADAYRDRIGSLALATDLGSSNVSEIPGRFLDGSRMETSGTHLVAAWPGDDLSRFEAGIRYSRFRVRVPGTGATNTSGDDLTGHVGLSRPLGASGHWRLVGNAGRAFRAPNVFDLGTFGPRPGNRFNIPNPRLRPETALSADLGLQFSRGGWEAEAYAFASRYRDKISSVLTGAITPQGERIVQSRNVSSLDILGIEVAWDWRLPGDLALAGSVTWTRGEEHAGPDTYPADRIPPVFGRLELRSRPGERLVWRACSDFASSQGRLSPRDAVDPRVDPDGTPGWGTLNLGVDWRARPGLELRLELRNVLDKRFREHGSGVDSPGQSLGLGFTWTGS